MKEQITPDLNQEAKAIKTDLYAIGYDVEFEKRTEHKIVTYKVEAVPRGGERGNRLMIVGKEALLSQALIDLSKKILSA